MDTVDNAAQEIQEFCSRPWYRENTIMIAKCTSSTEDMLVSSVLAI